MKIAVRNISGKETGREAELSDSIFGQEPNDHAIYLDVKQILANARQGTHKAKERGEITGSRRKIKRQKGTGTARAGDIKNPLFRGGGRVFGPKPHEYGFKLNKKVKQLARRSALSYKAKADQIIVVEDFQFDVPKTSEFASALKNLGAADKKSLVVLSGSDNNIFLSGRNVQGSTITAAERLNTHAIMNTQCLIISESALGQINEKLS